MFRFPSNPDRKKQWLSAVGMAEDEITEHTRICSLHFPNGDSRQLPYLVLGKRLASPKKKGTARTQQAEKRSRLSFSPPSHAPVKRKALTSINYSCTK